MENLKRKMMLSWYLALVFFGSIGCGMAKGMVKEELSSGLKGVATFHGIGQVVSPVNLERVVLDVRWQDVVEHVEEVVDEVDGQAAQWDKALPQGLVPEERTARQSLVSSTILARKAVLKKKVSQTFSLVNFKVQSKKVATDVKKEIGNRVPRSVLSSIAEALGIGGMVWNRMSIKGLQSDVGVLHHEEVVTRHLVQEVKDAIIHRFDQEVGDADDRLLLDFVRNTFDRLERYVESVAQSIVAGFRGQLDVVLAPPATLIGVEKELKKKMNQTGVKAALFESLLASPNSVMMTPLKMRVVFHYPVVLQNNGQLRLYKMEPGLVERSGVMLQVDAEHDFLAVSGLGMMPLTLADLQECERHSQVWLCGHKRLLEREPMSCISAMFRKAGALVEDLCRFRDANSKPGRLTENSLTSFLAHGAGTGDRTCLAGSPRKVSWDQGEAVQVKQPCQLSTPNYVVVGYPGSFQYQTMSRSFVPISNATLDAFVWFRSYQEALRSKEKEALEAIDIPDVEDLPLMGLGWEIVSGLVAGVASLLILCCCCCRSVWKKLRNSEGVDNLERAMEDGRPAVRTAGVDHVGPGEYVAGAAADPFRAMVNTLRRDPEIGAMLML